MGITSSTALERQALVSALGTVSKQRYLLIERMIDADCDYLNGKPLRIGVCNGESGPNPLKTQCISVGDRPPSDLMEFTETNNGFKYRFTDDVDFSIIRRDNNDIYYNLKTPEFDVTRPIQEPIRRVYKPISMCSPELDKIQEIFK